MILVIDFETRINLTDNSVTVECPLANLKGSVKGEEIEYLLSDNELATVTKCVSFEDFVRECHRRIKDGE